MERPKLKHKHPIPIIQLPLGIVRIRILIGKKIGRCFNLVLCYVMLPHFMCKIWCSKRVKSYALLCCVMICYADLFYEQNPMLSMSKILWSVMLCLWWHELKSKILWYVMLVLFVSKILCSVMNLTIYWAFGYSDSIPYPDQSGRNQMYQELVL